MVKIRYILYVFLLSCSLFSTTVYAESFVVDDVEMICRNGVSCGRWETRLRDLKSSYSSYASFKDYLKLLILEGGIKRFSFKVIYRENQKILQIDFTLKEVVSKIKFNYSQKEIIGFVSSSMTAIRAGGYLDIGQIEKSKQMIRSHLADRGYPNNKIEHVIVKGLGLRRTIIFKMQLGKPTLLKEIRVVTKDTNIRNIVQRNLLSYLNKPVDRGNIKKSLKDLRNRFFKMGYYFSSFAMAKTEKSSLGEMYVDINVDLGHKYYFSFWGNHIFSRKEILSAIRTQLKLGEKNVTRRFLQKTLLELYRNKGFYNANFDIRIDSGINTKRKFERYIFVTLKEGKKLPIVGVNFKGNILISGSELKRLYYEKSYDLAARNYYDESFYVEFAKVLRNYYVKRGFVLAKIFDPQFSLATNRKFGEITFHIKEGNRTKIEQIEFENVSMNVANELRDNMKSKKGDIFNPLALDQEILGILEFLRKKGYYYVKIDSVDTSEIVQYSKDYSLVSLRIGIELGRKIHLGRTVILGNLRTDPNVILRERDMKPGEIVTPDQINEFKTRLLGLGIFSTIRLSLLPNSTNQESADLLVSLRESDAITLEIAPGYRTDVGIKLSTALTLNNFWGRGNTLSVGGQVNRRLSKSALDARRQFENKNTLEYGLKGNYKTPYLFDLPVTNNIALEASRKRFYSFDADIVRVRNVISKRFTRRFAASLKYQYETIAQFDATDIGDNGNFQIGSITPSVTYDLRDDAIRSRKGAFFNFSVEWADPALFSQQDPDFEVNFYRWISRNRFYIPLPFGVFAISAAMGYEKNLVSRTKTLASGETVPVGHIPRIKVFRLNGIDRVRGFSDAEINRLPVGSDINDINIYDEAYFANFKLEPRYQLTDSVMIGIFLDGGRVYHNHFEPLSFRSSTGVTLKYLTPVGSLDFDYGVKLNRRRLISGKLEAPGRFHVSIGLF